MSERHRLSRRELQLVALISHGMSSRQIAGALGLSLFTVNNHRKNICRKLGIHSTAELVAQAVRLTAGLDTGGSIEECRAPASGRGRRGVLVIDDDAGFVSGLREVLHSAGYAVVAAHDGAEALAVIDALSTDVGLAVVDLVLPGSYSGFDLIGALARKPHRMKILAVSGVLHGAELYVAERVGADAVIEKPATSPERWLEAVDALLAAPAI